MKLALSTRTLPAGDHAAHLPGVAALGVEGVELAVGHMWPDPLAAGVAADAEAYRRAAEAAGLPVIGLHGLFEGRSGLSLVGDTETRERTVEVLAGLSALCRDLGGRTLVLGVGRGQAPSTDKGAWMLCREALEELVDAVEDHGTTLCFAPVARDTGTFCATAHDCYLMVTALDHPALGLHMGMGALLENGETGHAAFAPLRGLLDHVHVDEPGLALPGTGGVDHAEMRRHVAALHYEGWLSVVHACQDPADPLEAVGRSVRYVLDTYRPHQEDMESGMEFGVILRSSLTRPK